MNEAQKIMKTVEDTVAKETDEIIDFFKQKGYADISVHYSHVASDDELLPGIRKQFLFSVSAAINFRDSDAQ